MWHSSNIHTHRFPYLDRHIALMYYATITTHHCMRPLLFCLRNCCVTRPDIWPPWLSEEICIVHIVICLQFFAHYLILFDLQLINFPHRLCLQFSGLRMRNFTWNRFLIKNLLIDSLLTPIVESTYLINFPLACTISTLSIFQPWPVHSLLATQPYHITDPCTISYHRPFLKQKCRW